MSKHLTGSMRKELHAKNVGVQFLFDTTQARSSAIIFLQWCIAKPIADHLREEKVQNTALFVQVVDPDGREKRHLFEVTSAQELLQFHSPGVHTIKGTLVWGVRLKTIKNRLLDRNSSGRYSYTLESCLGDKGSGIGLKRFGYAELPVEVPSEFFAPEMSAKEAWWVNLWFDTAARNSCSIRRRRLIAYTVQIPLVASWVAIKTLWRACIAVFFGILCACRVDWRAIFHPFTQSYKDVWRDNEENYSWIVWDDKGKVRWWTETSILLTPLMHVILGGFSAVVITEKEWALTSWNFAYAYGMVVGVITLIIIVIGSAIAVLVNVSDWLDSLRNWRKRAGDDFERVLCTTAPPYGLRQVGFTPRLLFQRVKAAYCKPVAA